MAGVLLGPQALDGGGRTVAIGVLMHVVVAFTWSAVFIFLVRPSPAVGDVLDRPYGAVKVAALYGPVVWMVMSLVVIPVLAQRPPAISFRWWVQLAGHVTFVGLPIVASGSGDRRAPDAVATGTRASGTAT